MYGKIENYDFTKALQNNTNVNHKKSFSVSPLTKNNIKINSNNYFNNNKISLKKIKMYQ